MTYSVQEMADACREVAVSARSKVYEVHDAKQERWMLRRARLLESAASHLLAEQSRIDAAVDKEVRTIAKEVCHACGNGRLVKRTPSGVWAHFRGQDPTPCFLTKPRERRHQERQVQPPKPTIREALDAAHAAGGSVWDGVADPNATIREFRGEVQPPEIQAESTKSNV